MNNRIILQHGESFLTENETDALVLLEGSVIVSVVPFIGEEPGRAVRFYDAHTGDSVPSLFYSDTDGTVWRFSLTATEETELFSFKDGVSPSIQDDCLEKAYGKMNTDNSFCENVILLYKKKKTTEDTPSPKKKKKIPVPEPQPDCRTFPDTALTKKDILRFCRQGIPRKDIFSLLLFALAGIVCLCLCAIGLLHYNGNIPLTAGLTVGFVSAAVVFFFLAKKTVSEKIAKSVFDDVQKAAVVRLFSLPAPFLRTLSQSDLCSYLDIETCNFKQFFDKLSFLQSTEPEKQKEDTLPLTDGITVENLSFSYNGQGSVLKNLSLQIRPGEFLGVTGASGSGKSTLLRLLAGLETPQSGVIRYGETDLRMGNSHLLRRQTGFILQENRFFDGSIYENIKLFAPGADEQAIQQAAQSVGLTADLQTVLAEDGSPLSDGQKQRVALARVLVRDSEILFLDDAFCMFTPSAQTKLLQTVSGLSSTRILCTQQTQLLRACDRILVLRDGHVAQEGTYKELMRKDGLFRELSE